MEWMPANFSVAPERPSRPEEEALNAEPQGEPQAQQQEGLPAREGHSSQGSSDQGPAQPLKWLTEEVAEEEREILRAAAAKSFSSGREPQIIEDEMATQSTCSGLEPQTIEDEPPKAVSSELGPQIIEDEMATQSTCSGLEPQTIEDESPKAVPSGPEPQTMDDVAVQSTSSRPAPQIIEEQAPQRTPSAPIPPKERLVTSSKAGSLRYGVRAQVHSLVRVPQYNGATVTVRTLDRKDGRWECVLEIPGRKKEYLRLRTENLTVLEPEVKVSRNTSHSASSREGNTLAVSVPWEVAQPVPVPLPNSPWRIETVGPRPESNAFKNTNSDAGAARWQTSVMSQVTMDGETALGKVWNRLVREVGSIAGRHVSGAYGRLRRHLLEATRAPANGDVKAVLALAGSDVADHETTMRQVQELIRADLPSAHIAMVGPENLRSRVAATRRICEQLMCGSSAHSSLTGEDAKDGEDAEDEECEWPEDLDMQQAQVHRASAMDFADWHQERHKGSKSAGAVVLLVERADSVPKDMLRDVLSCWGVTCCRHGIPMFVVFGLLQPPQSRFDLLEDDPLVSLRIIDGICLFDAMAVCASVLEWLVEDASCLLVLPPKLLDWLRRDRFEYTRQSVSHIVKTLALLCVQFFADNEFSSLCAPLDDSVGMDAMKLGKRAVEQIFEDRLRAAGPDILEGLRPLWSSTCDTDAEQVTQTSCSDTLRTEAAQQLAEAALWRRRLVASLQAWDVLCCAVQPILRGQARLRRLNRLLSELWPQGSNADPTALAQAAKDEQLKTDGLLAAVIGKIEGDADLTLSDNECLTLLEELGPASVALDKNLQKQFNDLRQPDLKIRDIRGGLRDWFYQLRKACWLPLEGVARLLFLDCFCVKCPEEFENKIESRLAGEKSLITESVVAPLTRTDIDTASIHSDCALLYRLMECSTGKLVEVSDLWAAFVSHAAGDGLAQRFGQGLIALHFLGLHLPFHSSSGGGGGGMPMQGWRLRKRLFGRTWLKKQDEDEDADPSALWAQTPAGSISAADTAALAAPLPVGTGCIVMRADGSRAPVVRRMPTFVQDALKAPVGQTKRHEEERQRLRRPGPEPTGVGRPDHKRRRVKMFMA